MANTQINVIVVIPQNVINVTSNQFGPLSTRPPQILKAIPVLTTVNNSISLSELNDVDTSSEANGDVLIYNAANNTFVVETISSIDDGTF